MITFPNAKINLGLNILEKREDGYHSIESCFYPIPWFDCLEIIKSDTFRFKSYGLPIPGNEESNLCVKAYHLMRENFGVGPVSIHLLKSIPMGGGLGGGSADGAFTLKTLNHLFELSLSLDELEELSLELGSDCPFFIKNWPAIARGRGELLEPSPLELTGYYIALHNPGIHISTKEAYAGVKPGKPDRSIKEIVSLPITHWSGLQNDFEQSLFASYPEILESKKKMYQAGALYASMTGSGSTVYGIFKDAPKNKDWKVLEIG